jgi:hypothetical protein
MNRGECQVCLRKDQEIAGVAAVPGAAVSLLYCIDCLRHHAQPDFTIAVHFIVGPTEEYPDGHPIDQEDLPALIAYSKKMYPDHPPQEMLAEWFLEETIWYDGAYMLVGDFLTRLWNEAPDAA